MYKILKLLHPDGGGRSFENAIEENEPGIPSGNGSINNTVKNKVDNIWATIAFVVQVASVGCVVFAGIRYMYTSADQKADIKQGLVALTIGAVLVFGATTIIRLIANSAESILK